MPAAIGLAAVVLVAGCFDDRSSRVPHSSSDVPRDTTYWRLESVSPNGRVLTINYFHGDRNWWSLRGIDVRETPETVTITTRLRLRSPPHGGPYTDILHSTTARVELEAPLGTRRLVDPSGGRPTATPRAFRYIVL